METIVDIVGDEDVRVEQYVVSPQKTADPVVYQLVRVDDSGKLVPATDDEVIQVEDLLVGDKTEGIIVTDTEQNFDPVGSHGCGSDEVQFRGSDGTEQLENIEIVAGISNLSDDQVGSVTTDVELQSGSPEGCSKLLVDSNWNESSKSAIGNSKMPDFSMLKGEIRLDDLSVRDLQETFRATFGRETSVKDKQWLKRRIIMGLTHSCDFTTTTLVITDNEMVKKRRDTSKSMHQTVLADRVVKSSHAKCESTPTTCNKENEIHSNSVKMEVEISVAQNDSASIDSHSEQRPAKRVRKPTRRYIEELSEVDSGDSSGKAVSTIKDPAFDQPSVVCARPNHNLESDVRCFTRKDSLGGSGIQVPYVSRIRRSRPRENYMTLMKIYPSGMDVSPTGLVMNDATAGEQVDCESGDKLVDASVSPSYTQEPALTVSERCKLRTEREMMQLEKEVERESMESYKHSSDEEVVTVPTAHGGMRRKHHRPWSLSEVVKLVDGVTKYGVGRWSEIKRVAFSSYSYRTPVDLKDKWRNLLRASAAEVPAKDGAHSSRKQASVAIPSSILSRVRDLADIHQTQVPLSFSSSNAKLGGYDDSNKTLHQRRSGFL